MKYVTSVIVMLLICTFQAWADGTVLVNATPTIVFLNSLGINTHMAQGYPESAYEPEFTYTGIRNARDGSGAYSRYVTLHNNTKSSTYPGVKMDIRSPNPPSNVVTPALTLVNAGALLAIEGPNEPNNFPITYNGVKGGDNLSWVPVAQFQRDLYEVVKGNSILKSYPVFSVSEDGAETDNVGLQCLVLNSSCPGAAAVTLMPQGTVYADYANPHNYVEGNGACHLPIDNSAWNAADPTLHSCWDGLYGEYGVTWAHHFAGYSLSMLPLLPRVTTETGLNSSLTNTVTQGVTLLNVYLAQFRRGWSYTFIYEMVDDQGSPREQGIYTKDNVAKPAAVYIHNLTTLLADMGTIAAPGHVTYGIPAETTIPTIHDLLLQRSTGKFDLIVWDERPPGEKTDSVTVNFRYTRSSIDVFDPTVGTTAAQSYKNVNSVTLSMTDHPFILEVSNP